MANKITWDSNPSPVTLLDSELDSIPTEGSVLSGVIDNSTGLDTVIDFELYLAEQASARSAGACVDIYLVSSIDGTNYPGPAIGEPSINTIVGSFAFSAAVDAERDVIKNITLSPGLHKVYIKNRTGQTFASASNTLKYRVYSLEVQ